MAMKEIYAYRETGRRPMVWLAAGVFVFLMWLAVTKSAPVFIYVPWALGGGMVAYLLVRNPVSGVRLFEDRLVLSPEFRPHTVQVCDIDRIELISWTDSTDMNIILRSGDTIRLFTGDIPPREPFARALAQVGIPLEAR